MPFIFQTTPTDANGNKFVTSTPSAANPAATVGASATNGSANTFMRSDAAPALASQFASSSFSYNFYDPTSTAPYRFARWPASKTITIAQVSCTEYAAATTTVELFKNSTLSTTTLGTDVVASIQCGINGTSTTSFTTSTLNAGDFLIANVTSTAGTPSWTTVNVLYKTN
jgi:hypothetical protein